MILIKLIILTRGPGCPGSPLSPLKPEPGNPWKINTHEIKNTAKFQSKFVFN